MPGRTIATNFSSARNINAPVGGQWQASTSGVAVPKLAHGTVPAPGYTALSTRQVAQPAGLITGNTFTAPPTPGGSPSAPGSTGAANVRAPVALNGVGGRISSGVSRFVQAGRKFVSGPTLSASSQTASIAGGPKSATATQTTASDPGSGAPANKLYGETQTKAATLNVATGTARNAN